MSQRQTNDEDIKDNILCVGADYFGANCISTCTNFGGIR